MPMTKKALITGITGQDGSYLADLLISKGYEVHGMIRRSSSFNTGRIEHLYQDPFEENRTLILHYGDMTDTSVISKLVNQIKPNEIYNLAAQSHVAVSFNEPEYTVNADALGTVRILESIRSSGLNDHTKFYQASSSEMFGKTSNELQNEETVFYPRSPYGAAKVFSYWITKNYREAYGIFACNGILFNHESPLRGETFVTRKITRGLTKIKLGFQDTLYLGNLNSKRDWGHAKDFVRAQWLILQQDSPDDYVIATGMQISVREFVIKVCEKLNINFDIIGEGINEYFIDTDTKKKFIKIDQRYFRPTEVDSLLGDASKAKKELKWHPEYSLDELISEMVENDIELARRENLK
jgi:GDPmannose 4,6-dehydratase